MSNTLPDDPDTKFPPVSRFSVDHLDVWVYPDRESLGAAAAAFGARILKDQRPLDRESRVVFAAAPSQNEFLAHLVADTSVDWSAVVAFHMDEYLGIRPDHSASFRRYLNEHVFQRVPLPAEKVHLIRGEAPSAEAARTALDYELLLRQSPIDLVFAGIGENGHIAFNDPPVADFLDPLFFKLVRLDHACRIQQVNDGCFATVEDVPTHAFTMTIPALLSAETLSVVVPGKRKAEAVYAALRGPIAESCPASILRTHPSARLFLDLESARLVI